jgi:hypothetical protein
MVDDPRKPKNLDHHGKNFARTLIKPILVVVESGAKAGAKTANSIPKSHADHVGFSPWRVYLCGRCNVLRVLLGVLRGQILTADPKD